MCDCDEKFLIDGECGLQTCTNCGVMNEVRVYVTGFNAPRDALLMAVYERRKRFRDIMKKLLYPSIDNKDMPVFTYLSELPQFETVTGLLAAIKKSGIPDKRYVSLHAFCRYYLRGYKPPRVDTHTITKLCKRYFNMLETVFHRKYIIKSPFFNYAWLLRRLLVKFGCAEIANFVKPIKCPKRDARYEDMFTSLSKEIQALDDAKNYP